VKTNLSTSKKNMALSDTQIENDQVGNEPIIQKLVNFMDKLPIHKKMTIVVVSFVVIPLVLLMTVSGLYMQEQLRRDQERYLLASLAIARSEMQERENDILKCCYTLVQDKDLQNAVLAKNSVAIARKIKLIQENFDKVDYAVVVDNKNTLLAKTDASVIYKADGPLGQMVEQSLTQNKSLSSTEVFQLTDLFEKNSELFKKFQIKLQDGFAGKGEYLNKCLSETTIVPILNENTGTIIGSIVLIGVANSDYYFPQYVSSRATEGFLVLTVDGVRVATKSTVGEEKKWMVGTPAVPRPMRIPDGDYFIGNANLEGVDYVFMDEALTNSKGNIVGYISLGLPEERLNFLVTDNRKIGILISLLCILVFIPIGQIMATQLKRNHDELERLVKERTVHLETVVAQLKKLDIAKAQFLSNMTHELRTPLSVIINACDILKREYVGPLNEKQERNVQSALDCGNHLLLLINDLLDVSKMKAGMMLLNPSMINVKSLLDASVLPLKGLADKKLITMTIHREPDDFTIFGDANRLKQVYYNIISNAIKFTNPHGHIDISVFKRDVMMESIIKDNGIGIAPEDQERVFHEFEQVDNSYTRRYPGTGLGLPIVKQLVELHGGQVYIDSKLGQGTEVIFTIPLEQTKK
jgi:signal transduction histidine kinase